MQTKNVLYINTLTY